MADPSYAPGNKQTQNSSPQSKSPDDAFSDIKFPSFKPSTPEKLVQSLKDNLKTWDENGDGALSPNEARRAIYGHKYDGSDERVALQVLAQVHHNKTLSSFNIDEGIGVTIKDAERFQAQAKVQDKLAFPQQSKVAGLKQALDFGAGHAQSEEETTMAFRKMAAHAAKEFDKWDLDRNGFISAADLTNYQTINKDTLTSLDRACISFLSRSISNIQQLSNDENGPENDGITRADMKQLEAAFLKFLAVQDRTDHLKTSAAPTPARDEKLGFDIGVDAVKTIQQARRGTRSSNEGTGDPV
jgi:hypothetical protein